MALSVNNNYGAALALQSLNKTNASLGQIQSRITTGMKVASAKDDGAVYAIAKSMTADVAGYESAKRSVGNTQAVVDTSIAAGEAVSDLLNQMREKAVAGSDATLTTSQRAAYQSDVDALIKQVNNVVSNANFNGQNLVKSGATAIKALTGSDGGSVMEISAAAMDATTLGIATITLAATTATEGASSVPASVTAIDAAISSVSGKLSTMGTTSKRLDIQKDLLGKVQDAVESGISNLVDADLAKESARLQSLQVKQQLGVQALSIANQSTGTVLSFFR